MFTRSEALICCVVGAIRSDIRPLARSLDVLAELLFVKGVSPGDIRITKDVYPEAARILGKTDSAIAKSTERMTNLWWDAAKSQGRLLEFIGRPLGQIPSVCEILYYLAYYLYYNKPFFSVFDDLDRLNTHIPFGA